jgi:hypothetical protein
MSSFANPFDQDFRLLRGIPATLNGRAGAVAGDIVLNNVLVQASRNDPWIRAASTAAMTAAIPGVPAFIRAAAVVTFDFILCSGNGSPVPNDIVEIIVPKLMAAATVDSTVAGTTVLIGDHVLDCSAAADGVGRSILLQAESTGRVRGTYTLAGATDTLAMIRYRGIPAVFTPVVAPTA